MKSNDRHATTKSCNNGELQQWSSYMRRDDFYHIGASNNRMVEGLGLFFVILKSSKNVVKECR